MDAITDPSSMPLARVKSLTISLVQDIGLMVDEYRF